MKYGRVMMAAPRSGSGKTIITCGLLAWLKDRSYDVRAYKCGPDYIDPMFHRQVLGIPGGNLDTFFSDAEDIRAQIASSGCEAAVIEGVMGIYDGITGTSGQGSCYDVAAASETPVILALDVKGMGQTMLSVIRGILIDDRQNLIRGIILNRISDRYLGEITPLIDEMLSVLSGKRGVSVELIGGIPDIRGLKLESRHLGLMMPGEIADLEQQVSNARDLIAENLDTDKILRIMSCAGELTDTGAIYSEDEAECKATEQAHAEGAPVETELVLAVARDEAFCFYYEENLKMFERYGIRIEEFSPMYGRFLPEDADGILLGGGYPELHAEDLSDNERMRDLIREAVTGGMPCLAECGGFMYLLDDITDEDGNKHPMCAVIEGSSVNTGRLGRFGYITVCENTDAGTASEESGDADKPENDTCRNILSGLSIRGHEFHYFDSDNNGSDALAVKPGGGRSWECMHATENSLMGYPHLYYPSCPELIIRFREEMLKYREKRERDR